jgi:hypothetical protein
MTIRRWHRQSKWPTIKTLAEKGKLGTPMCRIEMRAYPTIKGFRLRGFNPTKGWRMFA